jgi:hypothetical protein
MYLMDIHGISKDIQGYTMYIQSDGYTMLYMVYPRIYHVYTRHMREDYIYMVYTRHMREDYIYMVYTRHMPGIYRKSRFQMGG